MMNVLCVMPVSIGGRLTTSSIIDGFNLLGHDVCVYDELVEDYIIENKYDLIIGYDFSALNLKKKFNLKMKSVNYFSDVIQSFASGSNWEELLPMLNEGDNYSFYWDRELCKNEKCKNLFYLPHFVNTELYYDFGKTAECDVMFAGRLDTDYRLSMIEKIAEEFDFRWYAIERHYEDALKRSNKPNLIKKIYSGFIDNEIDMAKAINKSRIVINMNSQGMSSLNYRTMQTLACGKIIISDERDELDLFDNIVPTYKNVEDLKSQINLYLNNDIEYKKVVSHCSHIVKENFNSVLGVKFMLNKVFV